MFAPHGNFGECLRDERESRGITLQEISARTRISVRFLTAIEEEEFGILPGGIFSLGFVRQYAHHVGLDSDAVAECFKTLTHPATPDTFSWEENRDDHGSTWVECIVDRAREYQITGPIIVTMLLSFIVGAVMWMQWDSDSSLATIDQSLFEEGRPSPELPSTPAGAASPTTVDVRPYVENKPVKAVNVRLSISETVWIRALADGERVFQRTFHPGESRQVEADEHVSLLVGNAGGVSLSLNGKPIPPIGSSGQVRRVLLTVGGMKILAPPPPATENKDERDSPRAQRLQASNQSVDNQPTRASIAPSP
ncbi:MAG: DUF4115 domain-containing protein [Bryobacterales bacterium]|nr:DUF4115 domain-containing protein [Bryobacterales bacterium]